MSEALKRILVVEDDQSIAELQKDYLELSGYAVTLRETGDEGLREALELEYDLIILDVMLPGLDGFEVCRRLREQRDTPVLFITAKNDDIYKIRGLGTGADDYMTKPFSPGEMVARVSAHIARFERLTQNSTPRPDSRLALGSIVIIPSARQLLVHGREVPVTAKEFDLLYFLAQNPNQVHTKEQLLNRIWGVDAFVESATVTVHINKIRDKIEDDPSKPKYIQTVWGMGYKFTI